MIPTTLVWSWRTLAVAVTPWPAAQRVRSLAIGHALAEGAGYTPVFYGDAAALEELDDLRWPWETRPLPQTGADRVPEAFWSGTKLVALRDARERLPDGHAVIHCDHDAFVIGPLADLDAPLYAQNTQDLAPFERWYPDLTAAFGDDLPSWYGDFRRRNVVHECGLVGGSSRYAVGAYVDEALRCAALLEQRGTLKRVHTWTLEQGTHAAVAEELGARVGFALNQDHQGTGYATWPGAAKSEIPLAKLDRYLPTVVRASLNQRFGTVASLAPPRHPLHPPA